MSQPVVIRASLIPPHFSDRCFLALDTFIDIEGQNWAGNTRLCTPLQRTMIQGGLPPSWPQLSKIAWVSEKHNIFLREKQAFPGNHRFLREKQAFPGNTLERSTVLTGMSHVRHSLTSECGVYFFMVLIIKILLHSTATQTKRVCHKYTKLLH